MMGQNESNVRICLNGKLRTVTASKSEFTVIFKYPDKLIEKHFQFTSVTHLV